MNFGDEMRQLRQRLFLTQESFASELRVSVSTVNRWESNKTKPTLSLMKQIKEFCSKHSADYSTLEKLWLDRETEAGK